MPKGMFDTEETERARDWSRIRQADAKNYRVRRMGSERFEEVSEQEYLDNLARSHQLRRGERPDGMGPYIVAEPERTGDIALPAQKKKARKAFLKGLAGQ